MRFAFHTLTTALAFGLVLSGCGGGDDAPAPLPSASTHQCRYGASSAGGVVPGTTKALAAAPDMKNILTECEFDRIYRGNSTTNAYDPVMYSENPGIAKKPATFSYYSYQNLVDAYADLFSAGKSLDYAPFVSGDYMQDMRELSAFLAHIGQETNGNAPATFNTNFTLAQAGGLGNGYGLNAITEGACATSDKGCPDYGTKNAYCKGTTSDAYPVVCKSAAAQATSFCKLAAGFCAAPYPDKDNVASSQYFGRGAKQLSYPFNYMYYGAKIYPGDPYKLGNNPSLIDTDGKLGWETGLAYWALPYEDITSTKPSMHDGFFKPTSVGVPEFDAQVGFGKTVNLINGGVECGKSLPYMTVQTLNRVNNYVELLFLTYGLTPVDRLEVTRKTASGTQVDVYTKQQLIHNISALDVTVRGSDYTVTKPKWTDASTADPATIPPHLLKQYGTRNANGTITAKTANYAGVPPQPSWYGAYGFWGPKPQTFYYGRYNTQPLIQEYYAPRNTVTKTNDDGTTSTVTLTDITKVMLYYDATDPNNSKKITEERLDCTGVANFEGK